MDHSTYTPACTVAEALARDYRDAMRAPHEYGTRAPIIRDVAGRVPAIALRRSIR